MTPQNNMDLPIYNSLGEHIGYIDIFPEIDKTTIQDNLNSNRLNIYLLPMQLKNDF